jgi:hypothetical protein
VHASSPGTQGDEQMVQELVHERQAIWPSTRIGSSGASPHSGQRSKIDDQLTGVTILS